MRTWTHWVTRRRAASAGDARSPARTERLLLLPRGLRVHDVHARGRLLRQDDLLVAVLPLPEQECLLGRAGLVPAERSEDRLDGVVVQPICELLLVELADLLDCLLEHLRGRVRVG